MASSKVVFTSQINYKWKDILDMVNELLLFIEIIITFSLLFLVDRFLGKEGLLAWMAVATILANIITAKNVTAFGFTYSLGTVMFASVFLATDVLTEKYGFKWAKKGVLIGLMSNIIFIISSQLALLYIPSVIDIAHAPMQELFALNLRITLSSMVMYFIANMADVFLYEKLKEKTGGKYMWLRNNVATIVCNSLENIFFMAGAFLGIFGFKDVLSMAIATSVIEIIVGLCDTPFLYLTVKLPKLANKESTEVQEE